MEEGLSPAPATTAEEVMASSGDTADGDEPPGRPLLEELRGAVAMATTDREESTGEAEPWAATVPPVRLHCLLIQCICQTFVSLLFVHKHINDLKDNGAKIGKH